jgi:hypothetical protein
LPQFFVVYAQVKGHVLMYNANMSKASSLDRNSYSLIAITVIVGVLIFSIVIMSKQKASDDMSIVNDDALARLEPIQVSKLAELRNGLQSGGVRKDGIPSIDEPKFTNANDADLWLQDDDVVFGLKYEFNGDSDIYAYPQRILVFHEIANHKVLGEDLVISYCPLTGTAIGYYPPDGIGEFGVSGKLVNSNLTMYDRETDSYWPQIYGTAINGDRTGERLTEFPVVWTTWGMWKSAHPNTKVLSKDTGFFRNYTPGGDPYGSYLGDDAGYYKNDRLIFDPIHSSEALAPKDVVIGIRDIDNNAVAIVKDTLRERRSIVLTLGDRDIEVVYDESIDFYTANYVDTGEWINAFDSMWFPWFSYYPDTQLIE